MSNGYNPGAALVNTYRQMRRRGIILVVLALIGGLLLVSLSPGRRAPLPIPKIENKLGVHLLLDDGRNYWPAEIWPEHMGYAAQAVGEWGFVTQLVRADDLDAAKWQIFMDLCAELKLTPILRLATVFDRQNQWWEAPPRDANRSYQAIARQYADFVKALRWPTELHYITVGNEPNHGNEWGGRPDPEAYARFLMDVAEALHAADPAARVLNAGFDPYTPHTGSQPFMDGQYYMDSESFMDGMVTAYRDVFTVIDAWASHAYPPGLSAPPWEQTYQIDRINDAVNLRHVDPPAGIHNRGVNGYEWELWKLSTYMIGALPVFITETGWRHAERANPNALDRGETLPDAATAAIYFDLALRGNNGRYADMPETGWTPWLNDARVVAITPFAFDGLPAEWGHTNWLVLDSSGVVLDTYPMFDFFASVSRPR